MNNTNIAIIHKQKPCFWHHLPGLLQQFPSESATRLADWFGFWLVTVISSLDRMLFSNVHVQFFFFFFLLHNPLTGLFSSLAFCVIRLAHILKDVFYFLGVIIFLLVDSQILASWWCVLVYISSAPGEEDVMSQTSASAEQPDYRICLLTF